MGFRSVAECEGEQVSRVEVLRELRRHDYASVADFDAEMKPDADGMYDALAVLVWLGY